MSSNTSAGSSRLTNNCETCEKIKSDHQLDKSCSQSYSSDYEEESPSPTQSENDKATPQSLDSMRLNLNSRLERDNRSSSRSRKPQALQQNKTFSSEKIREIERRNAMLVDKILYHNRRPNQYKSTAVYVPKITSSEINRRRHQEKIIRENEVSCRSWVKLNLWHLFFFRYCSKKSNL